jgi:diguanylate cyclase (GGDEF)-like protein
LTDTHPPDEQPVDSGSEPDLGLARPGGPGRHPERDVVALGLILVVAAAALVLVLPDVRSSTLEAEPWVFFAVLAGFALTEYSVFRFVFRRESIAFSISEIPVAFALIYLAPGPALLARMLGSMAVILAIRRPPLYKTVFNIGLLGFETALAFMAFRSFIGLRGTGDTQLVLGVILATGVVSAVSSILISVAISRFEGDARRRISSELRLAWWLFLVNSTLAGLAVALELTAPALVLLALVPLGALWYVMKAYGELDQRLRDLDAVHGFTGRVGQSLDPEEIGQAAVVEAANVLRTDGVSLVLFDQLGRTLIRSFGDVGVWLPTAPDDTSWAPLIERGQVSLVTGADLEPFRAAGSSTRELMVAPLTDQSGAIGLVLVAGRSDPDPRFRFGADDLVRLRNLTEQLAASLRKGMLHQRIEREAHHDVLTGLPNRLSFEKSVIEASSIHSSDDVLFVVLFDLDRFKEVNDTLGHRCGDELLVVAGERLDALLEFGDVLARLASDEFAVLARRTDSTQMVEFVWSCVRALGRPVILDDLEIVVTASAGVAAVLSDLEPGLALRHADIAMFNAKSQRLGVEVYRDEIDRRTPARLSMLGDLRAAIENDVLGVYMQPKLDLASGLIVGLEALVRWSDPLRGKVEPTQFVRIAEDTGLIKQLTDLMLHHGIRQLGAVRDRGHHLGLSVNLSTHDLLDPNLPARVIEPLEANGVDPSLLTLEITESSLLIDAPRARTTINELHELGVRLSIDDFGTGYSSLSYLRQLPVSELKIDQSFVANLLLDVQDEVIVRSTIELGHNLGLLVVAEGVENNEVLDRLQAFGCDVAQGYCISRPLAPDHLLSWLATTSMPSAKTDPLDLSRWVGTADDVLVADTDTSSD